MAGCSDCHQPGGMHLPRCHRYNVPQEENAPEYPDGTVIPYDKRDQYYKALAHAHGDMQKVGWAEDGTAIAYNSRKKAKESRLAYKPKKKS